MATAIAQSQNPRKMGKDLIALKECAQDLERVCLGPCQAYHWDDVPWGQKVDKSNPNREYILNKHSIIWNRKK